MYTSLHCTEHITFLLLCDLYNASVFAEQSAMTTLQLATNQQVIMSRASITSTVLHASTLTQLAQLLPLRLALALCHGTLLTGR
jgi:hypothetical protein